MKLRIEMGGRIIEIEMPLKPMEQMTHNIKEIKELLQLACEKIKEMNQ